MIVLPSTFGLPFGDEIVLQSIDWFENFPWKQGSGMRKENDKYEVCLHIRDFGPKDITVKTADGFIIVEGKHEERKDEHGLITRHFVRKYSLPEECSPEKVVSKLSPDGVLTITAPRKPIIRQETVIPVAHDNSKAVLKSKL